MKKATPSQVPTNADALVKVNAAQQVASTAPQRAVSSAASVETLGQQRARLQKIDLQEHDQEESAAAEVEASPDDSAQVQNDSSAGPSWEMAQATTSTMTHGKIDAAPAAGGAQSSGFDSMSTGSKLGVVAGALLALAAIGGSGGGSSGSDAGTGTGTGTGGGSGTGGGTGTGSGSGSGTGTGGGTGTGTGTGGGSGGAQPNIVSGTVTAGPVTSANGLSVTLFDGAGNQLGTAKVGADGSFTIDVGSYTGVVVAKVSDASSGPDFNDEATRQDMDLSAVLMAVVVMTGPTLTLNVNPLTTIAAIKAGLAPDGSGAVGDATVVNNANAATAQAFGLSGGLTSTTPDTVNDGNATNNAMGRLLAALSGADLEGGMQQTISNMAAALTQNGATGSLSLAALTTLLKGAAAADPGGSLKLVDMVSDLASSTFNVGGYTFADVAQDNVIAGTEFVAGGTGPYTFTGSVPEGALASSLAMSVISTTGARVAMTGSFTITGTSWTYALSAADVALLNSYRPSSGQNQVRYELQIGNETKAVRTVNVLPEADTTAPTLSITDNVPGTANGPVVFTFSFSENVLDFDASKVEITGGTAGAFTAIDGRTYTLQVTPPTDSTTPITVAVAAGAARDAAGNTLAAAVSASQAVGVAAPPAPAPTDTTAPTLTITDNIGGTANGPVVFTFTFSEDVVGFNAAQLSLTGGTAGAFNVVNARTYTLVATPAANSTAPLEVSVNPVAIRDAAGNSLAAAVTASQAVNTTVPAAADTTPPTLTITDNITGVASGPVLFTFNFSEDVVGFDASKVVVTGGTAGALNSINGRTYTMTVTPAANSTTPITLAVAAGAVEDPAGNDLATAVNVSQAVNTATPAPADTAAPTLTITDNITGTANGPVVFTFAFSEDVVGFDVGRIAVTGGTAGAFNAINSRTYTLVVTPTAASTAPVAVTVPAGAAQDASGNSLAAPVTASQAVDTTTPAPVDTTVPTLTITDNITGTANGPVVFTFTFSEDVVGFDLSRIAVTGGTAGAFNAVNARTFTLEVTPPANSTTAAAVSVAVGAAQDTAGNSLAAAVNATQAVNTFPQPTVQSFTVVDNNAGGGSNAAAGRSGDTLTFNVVFSEAVAVTGTPNITFTLGANTVNAAYTGGSGTNTLTFTGTAPTGEATSVTLSAIVVGAGSITAASNPQVVNTTVTGQTATYTLDNSAPTVTATYSVAENTAADTTLKSVNLVASETVTWSTLAGTDAASFGLNGGVLSFVGVTDRETKNSYSVSVTGQDAAGNATVQALTINLTNVNEAPVVATPLADQNFVVGGAVDTYAFAANAFTDVDGDTLTYTAALAGGGALPAWLSFDAATRTFSGNPLTAGATTVRVTASDGTLTVADDFVINAVSAPVLATTLNAAVTNLDVRSKIVLSVGESITANAGGTITLTDLGGPGFRGESTIQTQTISVTDTSRVQIVGSGANTKIIIDPLNDLDLSSNYSLSVSTGAFQGITSGQASTAFTPVNFSTVAPGASIANAVLAQTINETTGALQDSLRWFDSTNIGTATSQTFTTLEFNAADYAAVLKGSDFTNGNTEFFGSGNLLYNNFGANDLFYVDHQDNATMATARSNTYGTTFTGGTLVPRQLDLSVAGSDAASGGAYFLRFGIDPAVTNFPDFAADQSYAHITSTGWSNTGMVIIG